MASTRLLRQPKQIPSTIASVRDIIDGKFKVGAKVNCIGIVTDFRAAVPTRGEDWKCQIRFHDSSIEDFREESLLLNVFRPEKQMPHAGCGDVVLLFQAKIQSWQEGSLSLCTNWSTDIHVYSASQIPRPPHDALIALRPPNIKISRQPSQHEHEFVSQFFHSIAKENLPSESEFEVMKISSANVKDKFSQLRDVQDGQFVDVVVQVARTPYHSGESLTLWVSDYSENAAFFNHAFKGVNAAVAQVGDPHGYLTKFANGSSSETEWTGPFGKRSIQVTCYEPHASVIRDQNITTGAWLSIRNLQIKYGKNAANLEGFLRQDRSATGIKINIYILNIEEDSETINPHLKDAIRRKRDYEREKKENLKSIAEAAKAGRKRKAELDGAEPPSREKSKLRRNARRKAQRDLAKMVEEEEVRSKPVADLNPLVRCEQQNKLTSTISEILEPIEHQTTIDGQEVRLTMPFVNANYRTDVRVVDFMPPYLEDFASPKEKNSEFDCLSDNGSSSSESEAKQEVAGMVGPEHEWEWRFYLKLEDATSPAGDENQKQSLWVAVDNQEAQCLVNLDASNLRREQNDLEMLRQRLFLLWGDLEEQKSRELASKANTARIAKADGPPAHSSDDEGESRVQHQQGAAKSAQIANRPFPCCIRQFGVKVVEVDPGKADAGKNSRWHQTFGLFGTRIVPSA